MTSIKGLCPTCRDYRNAQVVAEYEEVIDPTFYSPTAEGHAYRTLKCGYCETIYFQHESFELTDKYDFHIRDEDANNDGPPIADDLTELKDLAERWTKDNPGQYDVCEDVEYWPKPAPTKPEWLNAISDEILLKLLNSVYAALEYDLRTLAAMGMRGVFERACELNDINPDKSFAKKLDQLHNDGHIAAVDKEILDVLTDAGSAAAHRGWEPDLQQLKTLASFMDQFVRTNFVLKKEAENLKKSIPPRQKQHPPEDRERRAELIEFPPPKHPKTPSL